MNKVKYTLLLFIGVILGTSARSQSDTSCTNLLQINSSSDEYLPFLIDSTLLFTSNRKNTQEGQTLEFTEKVYWSTKKRGTWSASKKDWYKWNSDNNTALVGVSPMYYYFRRSYWKNNGELFMAKRKFDTINPWKASRLKKFSLICSDFDENSITANKEDTLYFVSNRNGNHDIFMQTGSNNPLALDILNSPFSEQDVFISNDGKSLFFSSNRTGGKGGYDIYKTNKINNQWTSPVLVQYKYVNTESDDRNIRWYNDSTIFFSSNRKGGLGGFDIYLISITRKYAAKNPIDTIPVVDTTVIINTIPIVAVKDTIRKWDELSNQLKNLGLFPLKCELQLGAYRYIPNIMLFKKTFKCIEKEDIRVEIQKVESITIYKFIVNKIYTNIDEAIDTQIEIINRHCIPEHDFKDMPFIRLLDQSGNRFAIFWKKDEFHNKEIFYIYSNGKQVWKSKGF
ncbi:MAG: hypothetical protein V1781_01275 [Bacteroidota bacterium]